MSTTNLSLIGALAAGAASGLLAAALFQATTGDSGTAPAQPLQGQDEAATTAAAQPDPLDPDTGQDDTSADLQRQLESLIEHNMLLEQTLGELEARLAVIESDAEGPSESVDTVPRRGNNSASRESRQRPQNRLPRSLARLLEIGIDEQLVLDIRRREDALELRRLELQDQAMRDGSYGSDAYQQQLQSLSDQEPRIREEIGDAAYDRYLFAMGRSNRVAITSVMAGSPAEQAGLMPGDIILGYASSPVYHQAELRDATTEGVRGEFVQLEIQRDGQRMSLLIPRGPLGVRMRSIRVRPENG